MIKRKITKRFRFDYEYYNGNSPEKPRMLHLKIFTGGPAQVDLWLNEEDREKLLYILGEGDN